MVTTYLEIIWSSELLDLLFPIRLICYRLLFDESEESPPVFPGWRISGDEGDRTPDLGVANAALSHLSYIPTLIRLRYLNMAVYQINKTRSIEKRIEYSTGIFRFRFYYEC